MGKALVKHDFMEGATLLSGGRYPYPLLRYSGGFWRPELNWFENLEKAYRKMKYNIGIDLSSQMDATVYWTII